MTTPADLLAVKRAHAERGREAGISDAVLEATLDRILAASVSQPASFDTPGDKDLGTRRGRRT